MKPRTYTYILPLKNLESCCGRMRSHTPALHILVLFICCCSAALHTPPPSCPSTVLKGEAWFGVGDQVRMTPHYEPTTPPAPCS